MLNKISKLLEGIQFFFVMQINLNTSVSLFARIIGISLSLRFAILDIRWSKIVE